MKYKLIIFDLDGTILDTLDDLTSSVNYSLHKNGLPLRSRDEIRSFVGNGIRLLIERSVPENTSEQVIEKVFADFKLHYKLHSNDETKPYDGIEELLKRIRNKGIKTAVVSNKADFAVQDLVKIHFDGLFDFAVGEREGIERKPAPDSVFEAINLSGIPKEEAVYIGDSEVDVFTARNAGTDLIAVSWGFRDKDFLVNNGAVIIADSANELSCILGL